MVKQFFVFIVLLIPTAVFAGFQVVEDAPMKPTPFVALTYIGEPDTDIPVLSGFGRDLKLSDALEQIVPAGWHAFLKEDMAARGGVVGVNWKGGRRWVEVLDILANNQKLAIDVNWPKKHLYIGEMKAGDANKPKQSLVWTLTPGRTVGKELEAWGEIAGWKVIWNLQKDWSVPAASEFIGEFRAAAASVIKTLASNGALISAEFFEGNKTMVVTGPGVSE